MKYEIKIKTPYDEYKVSNMSGKEVDEFYSFFKHDLTYLILKIDNYITNKEDVLLLQGDILKNTTFIIKEIEND